MIQRISTLINKIKENKLLTKGIADTNFYFLANVGSKLINFLIIPFITRIVGVDEFAVFDLFILYSGILAMVVGLGMDSGAVIMISENKDDHARLKALFTFILLTNMIMLLLLWGISHTYIMFYEIPYVNPSFLNLLFIYTAFFQINYNAFSFLRWFGDARRASILHLLSAVCGTTLGFLFLWLSNNNQIETFLIGLIIGNGVGSIISIYLSKNFIGVHDIFNKTTIRELLRLSLPFVPTYLGNYLMQILDRFIVTYFFGTHGLGLYALANRIAQIPNMILQIVNKGFQPVIYANYETAKGQRLAKQLFNGYILAMLPITIITIFSSSLLVQFFGGETFKETIPLVPSVVTSVVIFGAIYLGGYGYTIKRKTYYITYITLATILITGVLCFVLAKPLGLFGIAFGTLLASMTGAFVYCYFSEKLYPFGYNLKLMATVFIGIISLIVGGYLHMA